MYMELNKEKVLSVINQSSMITPQEAEFFYDEIMKLPGEGNFLEIGTGYGHSTSMFSLAKPKWIIYTVDLYNEYYDCRRGEKVILNDMFEVQGYIASHGGTNVIQIIADSTKMPWNIPVDAMFIDGNHDYEFVKSDFDRFSPFVKPGGIILFHDANWETVRKLLDEIGAEIPEYISTIAIWRKQS